MLDLASTGILRGAGRVSDVLLCCNIEEKVHLLLKKRYQKVEIVTVEYFVLLNLQLCLQKKKTYMTQLQLIQEESLKKSVNNYF